MEESKPGQPTKYRSEYCKKLLDYFNIKPYETITRKITSKTGNVMEVTENVANDMPTLAGFAITIGIHRETLLNWTKDYPEFFDAYKMAKEYQENFLAVNGNRGLINPAFGIFTAKNLIGWKDKTEVSNSDNRPFKLAYSLDDDEMEKDTKE